MKFVLSILLVLIQSTAIFAQSFEGKILFSIDFPNMNDPQTAAMMPKEAVSYFKAKQSRMEMNMMMGMKNVTITDGETGNSVVLMDMMGQKYAIQNKAADDDKAAKEMDSKAKVEVTKETKMIAGYKCTKAILEFPSDKDAKEISQMIVWFTEDIQVNKGYVKGPMSKIKGSILEFSVNEGPMAMVLSAKEVIKEKVSDSKFIVPEGYKSVTQEELQKMMGGGR